VDAQRVRPPHAGARDLTDPVNPYATPQASVEVAAPAKGTNREAIWIGAAIGMGVSYPISYALMLAYTWILVFQGASVQELYYRVAQSPVLLAVSFTFGFVAYIVGGYWTARLSTDRPMRNALAAAGLLMLFGVFAYLLPYEIPIPMWARVVSLLLPIPAYAAGARRYVK